MDASDLSAEDQQSNGGFAKYESIAIDHAWNWCRYHAEQRMMIIRFYLIMIGAIGAAYMTVLEKHPGISIIVSLLGAAIAFLFWKLDQRVSALIKIGEAALSREEEKLAEIHGNKAIQIIQEADATSQGALRSYSKVFRWMFLLSGIGFLFATIYAILSP